MHKSEGKHDKTTLKLLQKKEEIKSSHNSFLKLYNNSIVLASDGFSRKNGTRCSTGV